MPTATMVPGGAWMIPKGKETPVYVAHEAHVTRLLSEGGRLVLDPREQTEGTEQERQETANALQTAQEKIARLEAELARAQVPVADPAAKSESLAAPVTRKR